MHELTTAHLILVFYGVPILLAILIARSRGRSGWVGFFLAAILGVVGMLACFFLPAKRRRRRRR